MIHRKIFLVLIFLVSCVTMYSLFLLIDSRPAYKAINVPKVFHDVNNQETPLILFWTLYFSHDFLQWSKLNGDLVCPNVSCRLTTDRTGFNSSHAVIFHLRDLNPSDLPNIKWKNQKFILFNQESPEYTRNVRVAFDLFQDNVDWTMSYRKGSDIHVPYGRIVAKTKNDLKFHKADLIWKKKSRSIAWMASHCGVSSNRDSLAALISRYIPVDIYGDCGSYSCPRLTGTSVSSDGCYEMIENNYKFYLSFENSLCQDYITEKVFKILQYNIIPIVYGGGNYQSILPYNSYIDVQNFTSAKDLTDYLNLVALDYNLYNSYFEWKKNFSVTDLSLQFGFDYSMCQVCQKVHNYLKHGDDDNHGYMMDTVGKRDLIGWWYMESNCSSNPRTFFRRKSNSN